MVHGILSSAILQKWRLKEPGGYKNFLFRLLNIFFLKRFQADEETAPYHRHPLLDYASFAYMLFLSLSGAALNYALSYWKQSSRSQCGEDSFWQE